MAEGMRRWEQRRQWLLPWLRQRVEQGKQVRIRIRRILLRLLGLWLFELGSWNASSISNLFPFYSPRSTGPALADR
jgi:hypothetical protein